MQPVGRLFFHFSSTSELLLFSSDGFMCLQMKPKLLPMIFIITADIAGGNATIGDEKWEVAKTTPNEEFCIPTCKNFTPKSIPLLSLLNEIRTS